MLQLETTTNYIVLSLKEKVTISEPYYYLFRFINKESKQETSCICNDIDEYEYGRQGFNLTVMSSGADNLSGQIVLSIGDEYGYYIYAQESSTNLNYTLANELVESGLMRFNKTITDRNEYIRTNTNRKVYTR